LKTYKCNSHTKDSVREVRVVCTMKGQVFNINISVQYTLAKLQESGRRSKTGKKFEG